MFSQHTKSLVEALRQGMHNDGTTRRWQKVNTWNERMNFDDVPTTFNDDRAGGIGHYVPEPTDALGKG